MTEILTDKAVADAFAQFRAEAREEILVPGVDTVRRDVRRRRRGRGVMTTAVAVCGLAGAAVFGLNSAHGSPDPGAAVFDGPLVLAPTAADAELQQLAVNALRLVGRTPNDHRPGAVFGPMTGDTTGQAFVLGSGEPYPPGSYDLRAACLGEGSVEIRWALTDGGGGNAMVACGGGVWQTPVRLSGGGTIEVRILPDDRAQGRSGAALAITDPRVVAARNALPALGGYIVGASGLASGAHGGVSEVDPRPAEPKPGGSEVEPRAGDYTVYATCAGEGSLRLIVEAGTATASTSVPCSANPVATHLLLHTNANAPTIAIRVEPDEATVNHAAFAYEVGWA